MHLSPLDAGRQADVRPLHSDAVTAVRVCGVYRDDGSVAVATGGKDLFVAQSRLARDVTVASGRTSGVAGVATGTNCQGHAREVTSLDWAEANDALFSCSRDKTVKQWERETGRELQTFRGHTTAVAAVAAVAAGAAVVSGGRDGTLVRWDVATGGNVREARLSQNVVTSLRRVPGTELLLQASEDKQLRLWDALTLKPVVAFPRQQYIHTCCDAAADGNVFLTGSNGFNGHGCFVTLWDRRRADKHVEAVGHTQGVTSCVFLSRDDGSSSTHDFCTASMDGSLKMWRGVGVVEVASHDLQAFGGSHALASCAIGGSPVVIAGTVSGAVTVLRCGDNTIESLGVIAPAGSA